MGHLFLIVGPSGVGKDTMIERAAERIQGLEKAKRVITRENNDFEDFESISKSEFDNQEFFISWKAHNKKYGIPKLGEGNYIMNVSRKVIDIIRNLHPETHVIELTARPDVLLERQMRRGRDSEEEIMTRLKRRVEVNSDHVIDTSSPDINEDVNKLVNYIKKKILP